MTAAAIPFSGNRCGHDPAAPRFFEVPADHKARPGILSELIRRILDYYKRPNLLPTLNYANGTSRQQRSERREGCIALIGALVHYVDLKTLRVGVPVRYSRAMRGLSMETLAQRAGINLRRAERAMADLVAAGIVKVHRICEQDASGNYKGLPAIRTISEHLFQSFGLGKRLSKERKKAYRRDQVGENDKGRQGLAMAAIKHRLTNDVPTVRKPVHEHLKDLKGALAPPG